MGVKERSNNVRGGRARLSVALEGGAWAGLVSGSVLTLARLLILSLIALLFLYLSPSPQSALARMGLRDLWVGLKFPAYPFVGQRSLEGGFDVGVVVLGVTAHLACTAAAGLLFGLAAIGRSPPVTLALGLLWGVMGATAETYALSRMIGGGLVASPGIVVVFIIYGIVLANTFLRFERHRHWPVGHSRAARVH